ncbi:flagellin [Anoxybacillus ayderensis]|uniref:flagellin N-terminal helical domain-containing protein n=1 Tax=Anoxybacillus ayderensis TaxID=265546 RepID=UPI002E23C61D|nr:flagellin [Anoxybacillus ayderensis]MED0658205.1 flagellin [Anoxybacillus ayderensis]
MRINHNIQALNAYRNLAVNQSNTAKNLEKLSSGLRINRAADDAAGLAISEKMRSQIRGLEVAERNALDAISLIQTAEGALDSIHSMLQRMRELAVQAANGTNTDDDRAQIQKEIQQLKTEIDRVGNATEFNTKKLIDGSNNITSVQEIGGVKAQTVNLVYAKGVSFSGTGKAPTIYSADGENTIKFSGSTGGFNWGNLDVSKANTLTLEKSGADILLTFIGEDGDGDQLNINAEKMVFDGTKYSYNNNGIQFEIKKEDFDKMDNGDQFILKLGAGGLEETDVTSQRVSTRNDWNSMTVNSNGDAAAFQGSGISVDPTNDQFLANTAYIQISGSGLDNNGGSITVKLLDKDGNEFVTETYTFASSQQNSSFSYNNNGISFTLDIKDAIGFDGKVELQKEILTKTTDKSLKFQIGANAGQGLSLEIGDMRAAALKIDDIDISTYQGASAALVKLDEAIKKVSEERGKLGAIQNRLEHTINNLKTAHENLTSAESRIRDTDMAMEMTNFTKNNILNQAAQAMLAQSNQLPQGILQLLKS